MAPSNNAEMANDAEAMALKTGEALVYTASKMSLDDGLLDGLGCDLNRVDIPIQVPPSESLSVFEKFPEVFTDDTIGDADNTHYSPDGKPSSTVPIYGQVVEVPSIDPHQNPYSYMVEHPGQVPKMLLSPERDRTVKAWTWSICHPRYVASVPITDYHAYNIEGEKALELQIKNQLLDPMTYLLVVRGFKLLMTLRNMTIYGRAVIDARMIGLFIGRLFCGDCALLKIFSEYFLPQNLEILPGLALGEIHRNFETLYAHFSLEPAARTPEMVHLLRILKYFDEEVRQGGVQRCEFIGRLMVVKPYTDLEGNRVEVPRGGMEVPAGPELPRCLGVSQHFMAHYSWKWPFKIHPSRVDVCRLLDQNPVERVEEPQTVCPRKTAVGKRVVKFEGFDE